MSTMSSFYKTKFDNFYQFKSLRTRITFIFLILIIMIQATGYWATVINVEKNSREKLNEEISIGQQIFLNLLQQNSSNLTQAVSLLATDYGFREAVSSNDVETILSALDNYKKRLGANLALFYDPNGIYITGTANEDRQEADKSLSELFELAKKQGNATNIIVLDKIPYQVVLVPVKSPLLTGWVAMGFAIDKTLATQLQMMSKLDVTFLVKSTDNKWSVVASTHNRIFSSLFANLNFSSQLKDNKAQELKINGVLYATKYVKLSEASKQDEVVVVLQRSIDQIIAPYKALELNLLEITILGSIIFIIVSIFTAKHISKPLSEFTLIAKCFQKGDYSTSIKTKRLDELGALGNALDEMRASISSRENKITRLAYWDELTNIPNRAGFIESVNKLIGVNTDPLNTFTVVLIDIDRFKYINNSIGHKSADIVLQEFAKIIKNACYKKDDMLARYGGDKFALLLPSIKEEIAAYTAKRIIGILDSPIIVDGINLDLTVGMGVANYPNHANTAELLISHAETAMYRCKKLQAGILVYEPIFDVNNHDTLSFKTELKEALEQNQLKFYVQPKLDLRSNKVVAVEALVRWLLPNNQLLLPDNFISVAERTGQISKISLWMLYEAASHIAIWQSYGVDISIAVNLSVRDLMDIDLPSKIEKILSKHKVSAKYITLEITESSIMEDPERAQKTVERLSNMGLKISIDDFGTGYSSFSYLKNLQVNELKVDKSFVINMTKESEDIKIVSSTIDLAHNMGLTVVAEGVENEVALNLLKELNCDYIQGYLISRPMPVEKFSDWLIDFESKA